MPTLILLLRLAGVVQIILAIANFALPKKLAYRENLNRLAPILRQIFIVHSAYIVGVLLLFAGITLRFPEELASGQGLGRFIAASLALFWLSRVPVQLLYYDKSVRRTHRLGDVAYTVAIVCLAVTYAAAALGCNAKS
jgi:hypothetical protein